MRSYSIFKGCHFARIGEDRVHIFSIVNCSQCDCICVKHVLTITENDDKALILSGLTKYDGQSLVEAHQPIAGGKIFCTRDFHLWLEGKICLDDCEGDSICCRSTPLPLTHQPLGPLYTRVPQFLMEEP